MVIEGWCLRSNGRGPRTGTLDSKLSPRPHPRIWPRTRPRTHSYTCAQPAPNPNPFSLCVPPPRRATVEPNVKADRRPSGRQGTKMYQMHENINVVIPPSRSAPSGPPSSRARPPLSLLRAHPQAASPPLAWHLIGEFEGYWRLGIEC